MNEILLRVWIKGYANLLRSKCSWEREKKSFLKQTNFDYFENELVMFLLTKQIGVQSLSWELIQGLLPYPIYADIFHSTLSFLCSVNKLTCGTNMISLKAQSSVENVWVNTYKFVDTSTLVACFFCTSQFFG